MNFRTVLFLFLTLSFGFNSDSYSQSTKKVDLEKFKRIDEPARDEVSGIVKDSRFKDVYWVHGDSGTKNRIYAINNEGEVLPDKDSKGLEIKGIKNRDWEDITIDENGDILIADVGNNCSCRSDQSIIKVKAPSTTDQSTEDYEVFEISYQKPKGFLYKFMNYSMDVEAVFWKKGELFALTKRFRGRETNLFKLSKLDSEANNEFQLVQKIDFDDEVTAAEYAFGKLAVLTYKSLWIFNDDETVDMFDGEISHYEFEADQVESVTFIDSETVMIVEESGEIYRLKL
ncbi:MAG: hypothetical protein ABJ387_12400 [Balneola sp.]